MKIILYKQIFGAIICIFAIHRSSKSCTIDYFCSSFSFVEVIDCVKIELGESVCVGQRHHISTRRLIWKQLAQQ
jgi:acetyltransferase-like isoleucine patch superfamily enzyme